MNQNLKKLQLHNVLQKIKLVMTVKTINNVVDNNSELSLLC